MGLDQFAYAAAKENSWDNSREISYWRKHPNLQGWMERLWLQKNQIPLNESDQFQQNQQVPDFNGIELELVWEDLEALEKDILSGKVAELQTVGFFFGNPLDDYYREQDLEFVRKAKSEIFTGLRVFYNSSW